MRRRIGRVVALLLTAGAAFRCGRGTPVATLRASPPEIRLGYPEAAPLRLEWSPSGALGQSGAPTVFVHVRDGKGEVRRTFDHPFPQPWSPGQPVSYEIELYQSALAPPLAPGSYSLTAGLYDPSSGRRWPLAAGGAELGRREYRVATLEVPAPEAAPAARFDFSGEWGPLEPDPSVQVLGRRRLHGPASLRFSANAGSQGSVDLALTVKGTPITVESDCSRGTAARLEPGYHWVRFDLPAGGICDIRFPDAPSRTSGPAETLESAAQRAASPGSSLDVAAWRRAPR